MRRRSRVADRSASGPYLHRHRCFARCGHSRRAACSGCASARSRCGRCSRRCAAPRRAHVSCRPKARPGPTSRHWPCQTSGGRPFVATGGIPMRRPTTRSTSPTSASSWCCWPGLAVVVRLSRELSIVRWTFVALTTIALTRAYGGAPGRWLLILPGQSQSNPFRWYALAGMRSRRARRTRAARLAATRRTVAGVCGSLPDRCSRLVCWRPSPRPPC